MMRLLVSGGASFIGSSFVRQAVRQGIKVSVIDKLTYAGDLERLNQAEGKLSFYKVDICDKKAVRAVIKKEKSEILVHFAAESHVDRSILGSDEFIRTNIVGTQVLLDCTKESNVKRFVQVSTDEVYGDIRRGRFTENFPLSPSSPYSASKAAADLLVKSYIRTFKFPAIIVRPSNNYGPWQYPEKFIPVIIYKALKNEKIPVYAKGENVREWLYVADCAKWILEIAKRGKLGETYNLGSSYEKKNIEVVRKILRVLGKEESLIQFVEDRPGHDFRYALNSSKARNELGFEPETNFETGIKLTVSWYKANFKWLQQKVMFLKGYWKKIYK